MPEEKHLQRRLGLFATIASAVGLMVASTTLVSSGQGFAAGGAGFIIPLVLAMIFNVFVAFTYSELSGLIPKAGGINHYTEAALGKFWAIIAVLGAYIVPLVFAASAEAALPGLVITQAWIPDVDYRLISTLIVVFLVVVNLLGVQLFAAVQMFTTVSMMGSILVLGIIGFTTNSPNVIPDAYDPFNPLGWGVLALLGLGFWLFIGTEFVTPLAEEIKRPQRNIPLGMILGLVIIVICAGVYGLGSIRVTPLDLLRDSPTPHVDMAEGILGQAGMIWMTIVTILASVTTVNTLICGTSRFLYGMSLREQAPRALSNLSKRGVPWIGILLCGVVIEIVMATGVATADAFLILILASMVCYCVSYIIAHIDVIVLRTRYPKLHRPFRSPLFPIPQILSMGAMVYMIYAVYPDPDITKAVWIRAGIIMGVIAIYAILWVKVYKKKPLFKAVPIEELTEQIEEELGPKEIPIP